jgi:glutathione S-transferase
MITVYAFRWAPPFAQGLLRDLRVRWALEEAGIPYRERLIGPRDQSSPECRSLQRFGQVVAIESGDQKLFESSAILLHIAEQSEALMPREAKARARTSAWVTAALNSVEPRVQNLAELDAFFSKEPWAAARRPSAEEAANERLAALEDWLGDRPYLEDRFTAADLLMSSVLRILRDGNIVSSRPRLKAYQERCEARPAFHKALADHLRPLQPAQSTPG